MIFVFDGLSYKKTFEYSEALQPVNHVTEENGDIISFVTWLFCRSQYCEYVASRAESESWKKMNALYFGACMYIY